MEKNNKKRALFSKSTLIAFVLGISIGFLPFLLKKGASESVSGIVRVRSGPTALINPLLGIEIPENSDNEKYQSAKNQVQSVIRKAVSDKTVSQASVYFRDLLSGQWFGLDETNEYFPGSLLKVPTLVAYLKIAQVNPDILDKVYPYDLSEDYNKIESIRGSKESVFGQNYSIDDLLGYMIKQSDNNAGVFLASIIDLNFQKEVYTDLGLSAPDNFDENSPNSYTISPKSYSIFFRTLYNSTYLGHEMSEKALELLADSEFKDGLVAGVPSTITVAHKFGESIDPQNSNTADAHGLNDCGIIYDPEKPYLLCVMTKGKNTQDLEKVIAQISKTVYEQVGE